MQNRQVKLKKFFKVFYNDCKKVKKRGLKWFVNKRKYEVILLMMIIFILFTVPLFINNNNTVGEVVKNFGISIEKGNKNKLNKYVLVDNEKVSSNELAPIVDYYIKHKDELDRVLKDLKKNKESVCFKIIKESGFFKDKYYINIGTSSITFKLPTPDTKIIMNDKKIVADKKENKLVQGAYQLQYIIKTEFGNVSGEKEVDIFQNEEIKIDADIVNITLHTNFPDGKVFIGNKELKNSAGEIVEFGPIPTNKTLEIYISRDFPWGTIESEKVKISKDNHIKLDIDMVNDKLREEISDLINKFYEEAFEALNKNDMNLIVNSNKSTKEKISNYIKEKALIFTNNYTITDLNVGIEKSEFKFEDDEYRASIYTNIDYKVSKKLLPFIKSREGGKFLLSLIYENDNWIVDDIQKFNDEQ